MKLINKSFKNKHSTFSVAQILASTSETLSERWDHHFGHLSHDFSVARSHAVAKIAALVVVQTEQRFDSIKKKHCQKSIQGELHRVAYSGHSRSQVPAPTLTYEDICTIAKSCGWAPKSSASRSYPIALKSIQGLLRSLEKLGVLTLANANQYAKKGCEKYPWLRADNTIAFYVDLGPKALPMGSIPLEQERPLKHSPIDQAPSQEASNTTLSDPDWDDWNEFAPPSDDAPVVQPPSKEPVPILLVTPEPKKKKVRRPATVKGWPKLSRKARKHADHPLVKAYICPDETLELSDQDRATLNCMEQWRDRLALGGFESLDTPISASFLHKLALIAKDKVSQALESFLKAFRAASQSMLVGRLYETIQIHDRLQEKKLVRQAAKGIKGVQSTPSSRPSTGQLPLMACL